MNHSSLHSVFQTNQSNNQQSNFEAVQSGKKKKKQKMVRADPSLLGELSNLQAEVELANWVVSNNPVTKEKTIAKTMLPRAWAMCAKLA